MQDELVAGGELVPGLEGGGWETEVDARTLVAAHEEIFHGEGLAGAELNAWACGEESCVVEPGLESTCQWLNMVWHLAFTHPLFVLRWFSIREL